MRVVLLRAELPEDDRFLRLLAEDHELAVYTGGDRTPAAPAPYRTRRLPALRLTGESHVGWWLRGLGRALRTDAPHLVHVAEEPWSLTAVRAALHARRRPTTRLVLHGMETIWWHGPAPERLGKRLFSGFTLGRADAWAAEGRLGVERALAHGFDRRDRTAVIHTNPRDPERFRPLAGSERATARGALGLPRDGLGFGFAGRLVEEKGPLLFLDAWAHARPRLPAGAWAVLAGSGPIEHEVATRAARLGVAFLGPLPYPDGVATFWGCLDVAAVPSWTTGVVEEQGPRVVIEAMLSGCVVVGADSGAIPEMLDGHGVVFPQRDTGALAGALETAARRLAAEPRLADRARAAAGARYGADATAARLRALWGALDPGR